MDEILWAEVDLGAVAHNVKEVKRLIPTTCDIMAVVKADGYGHGSFYIAQEAIKNGAKYLAVARLEEAIYLRDKGIDGEILVFGYVPLSRITDVLNYNLSITIFDINQARDYEKVAMSLGHKICAHIKVDTGMGRVGFVLSDKKLKQKSMEQIFEILNMKGILVSGIYTHFACADEDDLTYTKYQLSIFRQLTSKIEKNFNQRLLYHAANSAGTIQMPTAHLDLVRPGIMLYGLYPSDYIKEQKKVSLIPAMSLKAKIVQIKEVDAGFRVSYSSTYVTNKRTKLATIPIGYADGYPRILSSKGEVLIKGKRAKICGRVCMDQLVVDVTEIDAKVGDEVLLFGKDRYGELSVDEVANWAGTINYEIVSALTKRVKRIYVTNSI